MLYECVEGFYPESGSNISVCSVSGVWGEVSVKCKGKVTVAACVVGSAEHNSDVINVHFFYPALDSMIILCLKGHFSSLPSLPVETCRTTGVNMCENINPHTRFYVLIVFFS